MQSYLPVFWLKQKKVTCEPIEVGITGVKYVCDRRVNIWKRVGWFLALLACFVACIYQLADRIIYYMNEPIMTTVVVMENQAVPMPALTICPSISTMMTIINLIIMDLFERGIQPTENCPKCMKALGTLPSGIKMSDVWNLLELNGSAIETVVYSPFLSNFQDEDTEPFKIIRSTAETPGGKCVTLTPVILREYVVSGISVIYTFNLYNILPALNQLARCTKKCVSSSDFTFHFNFHDTEVSQKHTVAFYNGKIQTGQTSNYHLNTKEYFSKMRKRNQCVRDEDKKEIIKNVEGCVDQIMAKNMPCRLPFIKNASNLKFCGTPGVLRNAMKIAVVSYIFNATDMRNTCDLTLVPCHKIAFTTIHTQSSEAADNHTMKIQVDIQNVFDTIKEESAYTGTALISDIGGSLGFLLGVCVLHIVEIFDYLFTRLRAVLKVNEKSITILK